MKRHSQIVKPEGTTNWVQFVTKVLAFIGLWQVLSNSTALLNHWF
ncbi:MAG: hypothetical protein VKJ46_07835 [Leptolyngbyaceae bacterium]|nr:hypothetical protein [Leptolyngbyaceae bacterium]